MDFIQPPCDAHDARIGALRVDGYVVVAGCFSPAEIDTIRDKGVAALVRDRVGGTLRGDDGSVYGARNVTRICANAASVWRRPPLPRLLIDVLGPRFGLVRVLFFDKPPEQTWALPWHRDLTIAVKNNRLPSERFRKPTFKAGVPHIQAPQDVLQNMLTLRLHLDDVTPENGPLRVVPGSHRDLTASDGTVRPPVTILAAAGDVLVLRPLLLHCSNRSHPGTRRHRRVLHLEFAAAPDLPDRFAWHEFVSGAG
jgi:Phytanoyl-CoA dioxygenase (PhyH)